MSTFLIPLKEIYLDKPKLQTFRAQSVLHGHKSNSRISRYITRLRGVGGFVSDTNSLLIALAVLEQTAAPIKEISKWFIYILLTVNNGRWSILWKGHTSQQIILWATEIYPKDIPNELHLLVCKSTPSLYSVISYISHDVSSSVIILTPVYFSSLDGDVNLRHDVDSFPHMEKEMRAVARLHWYPNWSLKCERNEDVTISNKRIMKF